MEQRVARIKRAATTACVKRVTSTIMKPKAVLVSVYSLFSEKSVKDCVNFGGGGGLQLGFGNPDRKVDAEREQSVILQSSSFNS